jgi:hypothetical protein
MICSNFVNVHHIGMQDKQVPINALVKLWEKTHQNSCCHEIYNYIGYVNGERYRQN